MTATRPEDAMPAPTRKRRDDPEAFDPQAERHPPNGIEAEYKGARVAISSSPMTAVILVVLMIGVALAYVVTDNRAWHARAEASWRNHHDWTGYDHMAAAYDRKRDQCLRMFDTQQLKRLNEEMNIGGDPLQLHCRWLGTPPVQPTMGR